MTDLADGSVVQGAALLSPAERDQHLAALKGWELCDGGKAIRREWRFKTFRHAAGLANLAAWQAEAMGHHPEITFGWGHACVILTTHSAGGVTMNDLIMAARLNRAVDERAQGV